jgi:ferrous iron transport protein B
MGLVGDSREAVAEQVGAGESVYAGLQAGFPLGTSQAYAYLLFILLYPPCVAAFGAMAREIGARYALLASLYLLVVAWAVATLFYQFTLGGSPVWVGVSVALLALMVLMFWVLGRRSTALPGRVPDAVEGNAASC